MTDNEIKKALDKCASIGESCEGCPFYEYTDCDTRLKECFHDLIKRKDAEIEELYKSLDKRILENEVQKAEVERLKKYNTNVAFKHYHDGIKEFAERLKNKSEDCTGRGKPYVTFEDIDDLVKEMTENGGAEL